MLKTKLTALCAALLLGVAVCLSAAMLWQVREQAYGSLLQNSKETLEDLLSNFDAPAFRALSGESTAAAQRAQLIYAFRSCGVPGSALLVEEACLYAATPIHPESYLDLSGTGVQSVRAQVQGRHFLILGKTVDIQQTRCGIYLVRDADDIHARLWQLGGRFALLAAGIGLVGLGAVRLVISRALGPLSELTRATECIAGGSYSQRIPVRARDELGLLAENFNRMAGAVENHVAALQEQNARQKLFIGAVSHELKTPLTSLLLNVNTLQTVYLPEEKQAALLGSMDSQLHWLETMVKKLLTLLSLQKNAKLAETSVPALLEQVRLLTGEVCAKYGVALKIQYRVETLFLDKDLLCSALVNLVENGAKASKPGDCIEILADSTGFTVTDHGRGIPEKDLARVTDPFYMGDPSRSKQSGGFGLGLALVKEIAAAHGGTLELTSRPGQGTAAKIRLPKP